ncbi:class I SAM-dependent methyltransferase [Alphaproteobacteria bacterium]|nr:class I SAM-dependent methyltransferase [Alphaproteobacteria bacterium]MDC1023108.1 class I SAM-dependent methyltransferase [Alphaproteobacteria bacterium]
MKNKFKDVIKCRLCNSNKFREFIDFGHVPLGNNLQISSELAKIVDSYELKVLTCMDCNHFQLSKAVSPELMYATNYTYLSGIGNSFVEHIKDYVDTIITETKLKKNNVVVDIGSNDGTCLQYFRDKGLVVCGVDPAKLPSDIANSKNIFTINKFFNKSIVEKVKKKFGYVDLVTSQNVLAHVDDLRGTFENIYDLLKLNGYFVFEIGYFQKVLESMCFDTIYHEHIDYHHANPVVKFLCGLGFDVIKIDQNNIQGGSLRLILKKTDNGIVNKQPRLFLEKEKKSILYSEKKQINWKYDLLKRMEEFRVLFLKYNSKHTLSFAYGAPTKATLLLKMSGFKENDISFVIDDNNLKVGRYLPNSDIVIKSSKEIDYNKNALIVLLAWNFADDIIKKLKDKYKTSVTLLIPLPYPRVINI